MTVLNALWLFAQLVVAAVGGLIAAGIWLALGGLGAISNLKKRTEVLDDEVKRLNDRVSRDQKTRAALIAVEARTEAKSIKDEATLHLASNNTPTGSRMPGRTQRRS